MTRAVLDFLKEHDVKFSENFELAKISSISIGGRAEIFAEPKSEDEFIKLIDFLKQGKIKFKVIGNMSNVLAMTEGYNGVVIKTSKMSKYSVADSVLAVECGALLSPLIKKLATVGFCGLESLYGIPGSIGGMIFNNAGAYGSCISDRFIDASIYFPLQKRIAVITKEDMLFSYRVSFLKHKEAYVLSARFNLIRKESAAILSDIENIILRRRSSQPYGALSLGSVFKRCGEIAISKLIDELGMRGVSIGGAMVSEKHAGFIVNNGGATSSDFLSLVAYIKNKIYSKYQFVPEEEIEILK